MATSAYPSFERYDPATQVSMHAGLKAAQAASMVYPPAYVVFRLARGRGFSVRALMTVSTAAVVVGTGVGFGAGYLRLKGQPPVAIEDRVYRLKHNATQVRTDDYSVIGAVLGALITPAIFLKRAPLPMLVVGGASLGLGAGVWAHLGKSLSEGKQVKPEGMQSELPGTKAV